MFECLNRVDWDLLHRQKLILIQSLESPSLTASDTEALEGIVHLFDALQDDAAAAGLWRFTEDDQFTGNSP